MGTAKTTSLGRSIDQALSELETVTDEIRVKLHLANLEATATWNEKLEPRLFEARKHAREAKEASKAVIDDAVMAFKEFAAAI